jgi:hypothetical protein
MKLSHPLIQILLLLHIIKIRRRDGIELVSGSNDITRTDNYPSPFTIKFIFIVIISAFLLIVMFFFILPEVQDAYHKQMVSKISLTDMNRTLSDSQCINSTLTSYSNASGTFKCSQRILDVRSSADINLGSNALITSGHIYRMSSNSGTILLTNGSGQIIIGAPRTYVGSYTMKHGNFIGVQYQHIDGNVTVGVYNGTDHDSPDSSWNNVETTSYWKH